MSPTCARRAPTLCGFPRVSGDEPERVYIVAPAIVFSPRERG